MNQVTAASDTAGGGSITVTLPAGATGDLLAAWVYASSSTAPGTPTGWTFEQTLGSNPTTGTRRQHLYWRVREAGDTDVAFTIASYSGNLSAIVADIGVCPVPGDQLDGTAFFWDGFTNPGSPNIHAYSAQTLPTVLDVLNVWSYFAEAPLDDDPTPDRPDAGFEQLASVVVDDEYQTLWVRAAVPRVDTLIGSGVTVRAESMLEPHWPRCSWTVGRVAWGTRGAWH